MKLKEFAVESRKTYKGDKTNIPIVGLEHLVPGEIHFNEYELNTDNTFTKSFSKGQILFGRRRAYLKKAAVAEFDGICSGDITVIEAIPFKIVPELLPFIIQNDNLFNFAISRSAGGLSPRVKWEDLAEFEFNLPPYEEQKIIADKLWAAYHLKESYKKLLAATDDMVKSQFIEMFGCIKEKSPLSDFISLSCPGEWGKEDMDGTGIKVIRTTNFTNSGLLDLTDVITRDIDEKKIERKRLKKGDIILERSGGSADNPVGRVVYFNEDENYLFNNFTQLLRCSENIDSLYLFYSLFNYYQTNKQAIRSISSQTTGIQNLKLEKYYEIPIAQVSFERQKQFASIVQQADKSKFGEFKSQFIEMINVNTKNVSLDKIVEYIGKGITPKYVEKSDVAVINQACVYWEGLNLDNVKYHNNEIKCNKNYLENGDVLINATGTGTLGRSCIYNVPKNGLAHINDGHVIVIKTKNDIICPEILSMYFSLADTQSEIYRQYVTGSTNQVDIVLTKFRKMSIPIPDYVKQSKFVLIKQQADKSKFELRKSIEAIDNVIKSLINSQQ